MIDLINFDKIDISILALKLFIDYTELPGRWTRFKEAAHTMKMYHFHKSFKISSNMMEDIFKF